VMVLRSALMVVPSLVARILCSITRCVYILVRHVVRYRASFTKPVELCPISTRRSWDDDSRRAGRPWDHDVSSGRSRSRTCRSRYAAGN